MLASSLNIIDAFSLILFGVGISAAFLGVKASRKNSALLVGAIVVLVVSQYFVWHFGSVSMMRRTYPLFVHLPLTLFYVCFFKKRTLSSLLAVITAYLCCQVSKWLALALLALPGEFLPYEFYHTLFLIVTSVLIIRFAANSVAEIFHKPTRALLIFGALPMVYYIFDYASTVFSQALYKNVVLVSEFMPFTLAVAYLAFCVIYYRQYEQANEAKQRTALLEMQKQQSIRNVETMQQSEREIALLRHDMRHYLDGIAAFIEADNSEAALKYMDRLEERIDSTKIIQYCTNELINTVLATYEARMKEHHIEFDCIAKVGAVLPCSEIDFTSLLANALENALKATIHYYEVERTSQTPAKGEPNYAGHKPEHGPCSICLRLEMSDHKLLMSLTNPFTGDIRFKDGVPTSKEKGHGLGTESIIYVASKLKGNCQYSTHNDIFTLRVVV